MFPVAQRTYGGRNKKNHGAAAAPGSVLKPSSSPSSSFISSPSSTEGNRAFSPIKPIRHHHQSTTTTTATGSSRTPFRPLTNLPTVNESASDCSSGDLPHQQRRVAKRGMPGTPREEPSSLTKSTRLFSPVVVKKKQGSHHRSLMGSTVPPSSSATPQRMQISRSTKGAASKKKAATAAASKVLELDDDEEEADDDDDDDDDDGDEEEPMSCSTTAAGGGGGALKKGATSTAGGRRLLRRMPTAPAAEWEGPSSSAMMISATPRTVEIYQDTSSTTANTSAAATSSNTTENPTISATTTTRTRASRRSSMMSISSTRGTATTTGGFTTAAKRTGMRSGAASSTSMMTSGARGLAFGGSGGGSNSNMCSIFSMMDEADFEYLSNEVRKGGDGGGTSWRFGFGKGFVLFLPSAWEAGRRINVGRILRDLGFKRELNAGRVYYRMTQQKVGELRRELSCWRAVSNDDAEAVVAPEPVEVATEIKPPAPAVTTSRGGGRYRPSWGSDTDDDDGAGTGTTTATRGMTTRPPHHHHCMEAVEEDDVVDVMQSLGALALEGEGSSSPLLASGPSPSSSPPPPAAEEEDEVVRKDKSSSPASAASAGARESPPLAPPPTHCSPPLTAAAEAEEGQQHHTTSSPIISVKTEDNEEEEEEEEDATNKSGLSWACLSVLSDASGNAKGSGLNSGRSSGSATSQDAFFIRSRKNDGNRALRSSDEDEEEKQSPHHPQYHHDHLPQQQQQAGDEDQPQQQQANSSLLDGAILRNNTSTAPTAAATGPFTRRTRSQQGTASGTVDSGLTSSTSNPTTQQAQQHHRTPTTIAEETTAWMEVETVKEMSHMVAISSCPTDDVVIYSSAERPTISSNSDAAAHTSRGGGAAAVVRTFETPMAFRSQIDWGISRPANTDSIERLRTKLEEESCLHAGDERGGDHMPPANLRYTLPSPEMYAYAAAEERAHQDLGLTTKLKSVEELQMEAKVALRRRKSRDKARRVSMGIAFRKSVIQAEVWRQSNAGGFGASFMSTNSHPLDSTARRQSRHPNNTGPFGDLPLQQGVNRRSNTGNSSSSKSSSSAIMPTTTSTMLRTSLVPPTNRLTAPPARKSRLSICTAMRGLNLLGVPLPSSSSPSTIPTSSASAAILSVRNSISRTSAAGYLHPNQQQFAQLAASSLPEGIEEGEEEEEEGDWQTVVMAASGGRGSDEDDQTSKVVVSDGGRASSSSSSTTRAAAEGGEAEGGRGGLPLIDQLADHLTASCLEFLTLSDLSSFKGPSAVCRAWSTATLHAQARLLSDFSTDRPRPDVVVDWRTIATNIPCGQFLSEGAYKSVYRVWSAETHRVEALSIMDVHQITSSGNAAILSQELRASILMSSLVRNKVCPNHVETYSVLRTNHAPRDLWACSDAAFARHQPPHPPRPPYRMAQEEGDYQLIRMELCRHGDLEGYLRRQADGLVPLSLTRHLLFQMSFALYSAREAYDMRHYDIKLLNFLVDEFPPSPAAADKAESMDVDTTGKSSSSKTSTAGLRTKKGRSSNIDNRSQKTGGVMQKGDSGTCSRRPLRSNSNSLACLSGGGGKGRGGDADNLSSEEELEQERQEQRSGPVIVRYGLGSHVYRLVMAPEQALCIKLADFGTADLAPQTLGQPVGLDQFTTLENTPIDFLIDGDAATQGFAADAFSLGLAIFHLFTGSMPYEEIMEEVVCPMELREALAKAWSGPGYRTLARVLDAQGVDEDEEQDDEGNTSGGMDPTLFNTFYRYLVLLGLPPLLSSSSEEPAPNHRAGKCRGKKGGGGTATSSDNSNPILASIHSLIGPRENKQDLVATEGKRRAAAAAAANTISKTSRRGKAIQAKEKVTHKYWCDVAKFSLLEGQHPLVRRGRERMEALPGALELVRSLLDVRPESRPSMYEAMTSSLFLPMREDMMMMKEEEVDGNQIMVSSSCFSAGKTENEYMAYYRVDEDEEERGGYLLLRLLLVALVALPVLYYVGIFKARRSLYG